MPTELERQGNFSQSRINNQPVLVRDPSAGFPCTATNTAGCFPDQMIPANRLNRNGQAILNLFPRPNFFDTSVSGGNYNYVFQEITEHPKRQNMLKLDYTPTDKDRITFRGRTWWADRRGYEGLAAFNSNWNQLHHHYLFTEDSVMASYTRVFSPTIVNEFNTSYRVLGEIGAATSPTNFDPVIREKRASAGLGQLFPAGNPLRIIPQANFGGIPNAANVDLRRPPADRCWRRALHRLRQSLLHKGSHGMKFGFYYERNYASEGPRTLFGGSFAFDADANNPLNTGNAYANAALGVFRTYSEGSNRTTARNVIDLLEWFAQDRWKDESSAHAGLRVALFPRHAISIPRRRRGCIRLRRVRSCQSAAALSISANAAGQRASRNPLTGEFGPAVLIGAYVPGTGDPTNGMVTAKESQYKRWIHQAAADPVRSTFRLRVGRVRRHKDGRARRVRRDQEHDSVVGSDFRRRQRQSAESVPAPDLLWDAGYIPEFHRRAVPKQRNMV